MDFELLYDERMEAADDLELRALLERLEREEREISRLRRKLHDRLASFPNPLTQEREREVSQRRRELHAQIDNLRARLTGHAPLVDETHPDDWPV